MKKKRPRCHNCKFASEPFKIVGKTHYHCCHPKWEEENKRTGNVSGWDTLQEFWQTCKDHQFKLIADTLES